MEKVWFITGSSRGLGRNITEAALANGDKVAATARNPKYLNDLLKKYPGKLYPIELDVTNYHQVYDAVADAVAYFGKIDVLVNNAGFGIIGAAEAFTDAQVRSQLETNLYAPIEVTRAVLPYMREQSSGRILQISSLGGRVGNAGISIYQAAKFGLSGFAEALAEEVRDLGILVTSVEPGGFRTDWAGDSMTYANTIDGYDKVNQRADFFKSGAFKAVGDPVKAANVIIALAEHEKPPVHMVLGSESVAILTQADAVRKAEFDKWMGVSLSTDHDEAENFLETQYSKAFLKN